MRSEKPQNGENRIAGLEPVKFHRLYRALLRSIPTIRDEDRRAALYTALVENLPLALGTDRSVVDRAVKRGVEDGSVVKFPRA